MLLFVQNKLSVHNALFVQCADSLFLQLACFKQKSYLLPIAYFDMLYTIYITCTFNRQAVLVISIKGTEGNASCTGIAQCTTVSSQGSSFRGTDMLH